MALVVMCLFSPQLSFTQAKAAEQNIEEKQTPTSTSPIKDSGVLLTKVVLSGSTIYEDEQIEPFISAHIGKRLTPDLAKQIARSITKMYRRDGFKFSYVQMPDGAWRTEKGELLLEALEKSANDVRIVGAKSVRPELFGEYRNKILQAQPYNEKLLERYVLLADDLPGNQANSLYRPRPDIPGATDIVIQMKEEPVWDSWVRVTNRGSSSIGRYLASLGLNFNSFFGRYERIGATFSTTEKWDALQNLSAYYQSVLNSEGTTIRLSGNGSRAQTSTTLQEAEINNGRMEFSLSAQHPIIRSKQKNLTVFGSLTYRDYETKLADQIAYEDRLRTAKLGVAYLNNRGWQDFGFQATANATQGLTILNNTDFGSPYHTRSDGRPDFTKLDGELSIWRWFDKSWFAKASTIGQWSADSLLASEQFSVGGERYGRAYDSGEITGDHGFAFNLEIQYDLLKKLREKFQDVETEASWVKKLELLRPYVFYDFGATYGKGRESTSQQTIASTGVGLKLKISEHIIGDFLAAKPLTKAVSSETKGNAFRYFFRITAKF